MSLRDQLLAKGLVTKKQARKADQDARTRRKNKKGQKRKRGIEVAEARAVRALAAEEALRTKLLSRRARESERERMERALQIRNTILGNRIAAAGQQRFHHRSGDGKRIARVHTSAAMVERLRRGDAAIVASDGNYVIIARRGAEKLQDLAPQLLVFWQPCTKTLSRPDQKPHARNWEPELAARRATPEDIARFASREPSDSPLRTPRTG